MTNKLSNYSTLIFMISATMVGKVLGMVRDILMSYYYGTGMEAQAFFAAARLPLNFFDLALGAAVSAAFIPTFNEVLKLKGKEKGLDFANEFINLVLYASVILTAIGISFAPFFTRLIAGGYDEPTLALTVELTKLMFPMLIFTALAFTFVGILQSFGEFNVPAAISVVSNVIMIIYLFAMNDRFGIKGMAVAMIIGWSLQMLVQVPFLWKKGLRFKPVIKFRSEELKKVGIVMVPILISTWVQPINVFVNTYLASGIGDGSAVPILEYANKIYIIIGGVIILAITNLIFPSLSKYLAVKDVDKFTELLKSALRMVMFFMTPITVGVMIFSEEIIVLLYGRGEFTQSDIRLTAMALFFYSAGIVFYGFREVLNRAYFAYGDSRTPMNYAIIGITFNIILSIVLVRVLEINGLTIAASVAALLMALLLLRDFNKNKAVIVDQAEVVYMVKALVLSLIMGVVVTFSYRLLGNQLDTEVMFGMLISVVISTGIGIVVYFSLAKLVGFQMPALQIESPKEDTL